jgi:excisionase family DNA binding protein
MTAMSIPTKPLFSIPEAAEYLDIAPGTLRNWLSAKRLPYVKVGRLTRVSRRALDEFIEQHTVEATNAGL